jgi:hypothetical protein
VRKILLFAVVYERHLCAAAGQVSTTCNGQLLQDTRDSLSAFGRELPDPVANFYAGVLLVRSKPMKTLAVEVRSAMLLNLLKSRCSVHAL